MDEHHKINYIEFPAHNLEATKTFFSKTFDWASQDYGPDYTSFSNSGIAGGFFKAELNASASNVSALVVIYSNDLEDTYLKVVDAGGTFCRLVPPLASIY